MKMPCLLLKLLVIGLIGAAQVHAAPEQLSVAVKTYSTGYFHNGIRTVPATHNTQSCTLSTTTTLGTVASNHCTIKMQNGSFVLTGYAAPNAGVNCAMTCMSPNEFRLRYR